MRKLATDILTWVQEQHQIPYILESNPH